ncbi:sensor histidine kinase [Saccharicrinis carchari]|uniref:sensor histidine kinase n=1 Tax=Saccharicrinis carchari TaxID=1168039 RepID=UPI0011588FE6|nr:hybrid sensor histidine kinase/response regulator [Saccharicrinis carchari]
MIRFKKIGFQLQLILVVLVLSVIAGLGFAHYTSVKRSLFSDFRNNYLHAVLIATQSGFQATLQRAIETSVTLADDPVVLSWFKGGEKNDELKVLALKRLDNLQKEYGYQAVFAVNSITNNYWSSDYRLLNVISKNDANYEWFFDAIAKGIKVSINFDYDRDLNQTMLFVNVLMGQARNPIGAAGVGVDISILMEEFHEHQIAENSCFWLLDSVGTVKVSSRIDEINRPLSLQLPPDQLNEILQSDSSFVISNARVDNKGVELAGVPLGNTRYKVLMLVPNDELFPVLGVIKRQTLIFSVIFIILTVFIVRLVSRRIITLPLLRLKRQSEYWAQGDLDIDCDDYLINRKDEIGSLASSFEIMRKHLANNIAQLNRMNNDLTLDKQQLKHINEQLNVALDKASESERLTQSFLANISHEIRTPMNSIMGFSQLLLEPDISAKDRENYIGVVMKSGKQLLSILDSIINLSKIEAGVIKANWKKVDVCALVHDTTNIYRVLAQEKGLKVVCDWSCNDKQSMPILSDATLIQMVLNNLIANAIKFTDKGQVKIGCYKGKNAVIVLVEDTGIGIAAKDKKNIFEPFRQIERIHFGKSSGAGLGLAIVNKIVTILGGKITVESTLDKGSVFRVELPDNKYK